MKETARGRILIVEDDPDVLDSLRDALEDEGYLVFTARNGREGLDRLREIAHPCLILLDLLMPVMNGNEFLLALREAGVPGTFPVVVVSAWEDAAHEVRNRTVGFVRKPVSLTNLLEVAARFCPLQPAAEAAREGVP